MGKQAFLKKLHRALRWTFNHDEIIDILSDYEGFFVSGSNEGKSEQQICDELGNPTAIALDLAETLGKKKKRRMSAKIVQRMALATVLLVMGFIYYFAVHQSANIVRDSIVLLFGFTLVLWFALGGTLRKTPPVARSLSTAQKWVLPVGHIILLLMVVSMLILFRIFETKLLTDTDVLAFATLVINARFAFVVFAVMVALLSVYGFYRLSSQFFTVITHAVGTVVYLSAVYNILSRLDDPSRVSALLLTITVIYGVSVVLTILYALFIHSISRRVN